MTEQIDFWIGKSGFSQFDQSTEGIILGTDNGTTKFELVGSVNYLLCEYLRW